MVIAAHGSDDPRFAAVVESIARQVGGLLPAVRVRVGYLDHGPPHLHEVIAPGCVVVPLLLSSGHHVRVDIPRQAPGCVVTAACGPDPALLPVLIRRLREAGWRGTQPLVLAAAGSRDLSALTEVRSAGRELGQALGLPVTTGFLSGGEPSVNEIRPVAALASYLLAPGSFHDRLVATGVPIVSAPLGDAPELAEIVVTRYTAAGQATTGATARPLGDA